MRRPKLPGYTAAAALYKSQNHYNATTGSNHTGELGSVRPQTAKGCECRAAPDCPQGVASWCLIDGPTGELTWSCGCRATPPGGGSEGAPDCLYGHWCGPGCGGGEPINDVDACCKAHDQCYGRRGWGSCSCDAELLGCVCPKALEVWNPEKAAAAASICATFTAKMSSGLCSEFVPFERQSSGGGGGRLSPPGRRRH